MKKTKKALCALLAAVTLLSAGCGRQFDAGNYIKALLDNSYKNDSTAFVEQKIGTKEQAQQLYDEGIKKEVNSLLSTASISDGLAEEYASLVKDIYKNVKYTVGEAKKGENGSYEVEIAYQRMNIFLPAMKSYQTKLTEYTEEVMAKMENGEAQPTEAEINEQQYALLKDALRESLDNVTYEEEASFTMHVELNGNVYSPNENDIKTLGLSLCDSEASNNFSAQ